MKSRTENRKEQKKKEQGTGPQLIYLGPLSHFPQGLYNIYIYIYIFIFYLLGEYLPTPAPAGLAHINIKERGKGEELRKGN